MSIHIKKALCAVLCLVLVLSPAAMTGAAAAGSIYVNDSQSVLSGDISSAYVIGSEGVSNAGDSYVITGDGTVKLGQSGGNNVGTIGDINGESDGTTISFGYSTVKIGLNYYYNSSRNTALGEAKLANSVGSGFQVGYYDSSRVFHATGSVTSTGITMRPSGSGNGVAVYDSNSGALLYTHTSSGSSLAVVPISNGAKGQTWFRNNTFYGGFAFYRYNGGNMTVINVVNLEDYLKGVITIEMSSSWPAEALKAQTLCARTYLASNINSYAKYGFDITSDTYCQAYLGTQRSTASSDAAVDATAGEYVTYGGKLCSTLFFSSDGGATESSENIFVSALPYLRGKVDPYEEAVSASENGYKSWTKSFSAETLTSKLTSRGYSIGTVVAVTPQYTEMGNVNRLTFTDSSGKSVTVTNYACCTTLGVPSVRYSVSGGGGGFTFTGSGYGHNVGMSQFGAYSMAKNYGMNYRQIIRFYYTGVSISKGV